MLMVAGQGSPRMEIPGLLQGSPDGNRLGPLARPPIQGSQVQESGRVKETTVVSQDSQGEVQATSPAVVRRKRPHVGTLGARVRIDRIHLSEKPDERVEIQPVVAQDLGQGGHFTPAQPAKPGQGHSGPR